ncbi:4-hydroxy-tetrahydrodipicolinate synthase [Bordetella genomosp. 13]|uniref:4-hydroxy-tetrahydrodipicolinate synthase n=1 Tax=Bordetella genomosp. 13 TaxID=463040 RepID=A0A1W6ZG66_9BORD|nr:4-hydroxy-tetrahydrodipicolinate synthase [Bordetella genomosp. 13]ARP96408.1 4-hydroxy-tetrahydrodipicolinate synthase [Bordetella genomosp. 13]
MIDLQKDALRGSIPPLVTPFRNGKVDYDRLAGLVDFQARNGTHGVLINGTTSEPSTLTTEERNQAVTVAVQAAQGRLQVVAATGSQSHAESVVLTEHAARAGVDGLLVVTPYYIRPPQRGVAAYFVDLGRRVDVPLMMYHIPGRTAFKTDLATLEQIAEAVPHFVGIKHALDDHSFVTEMLHRFGPEFRVFVGLEEFTFPMMCLGAGGTMNAVANVAPAEVARLCNLVRDGKLEEARALHFKLFDLMKMIFWDTNPIPLKYMMKRLGLIEQNEHRLPMMPATAELEKRIDALIERLELTAN